MPGKNWLIGLVVAVMLLVGSAAWAQDFYVIAGGGRPVGTKITSLPYSINNPGFYFLTDNLTYTGAGIAINVNANDVTIDLMGFSLNGPGGTNTAYGIYMYRGNNVEIRNGSVRGFNYGIYADINGAGIHGDQFRAINVRVSDNYRGIWLLGTNHLIKNCSASGNYQALTLGAGMITDSVADNNGIGIVLYGPGSVLGNTACHNGDNFVLGEPNPNLPASPNSILVDRNSAFASGVGVPNYVITSTVSTGVVITANNSGTP